MPEYRSQGGKSGHRGGHRSFGLHQEAGNVTFISRKVCKDGGSTPIPVDYCQLLANHLHAGKETDEEMVDLFLFAGGDKKGLDLCITWWSDGDGTKRVVEAWRSRGRLLVRRTAQIKCLGERHRGVRQLVISERPSFKARERRM